MDMNEIMKLKRGKKLQNQFMEKDECCLVHDGRIMIRKGEEIQEISSDLIMDWLLSNEYEWKEFKEEEEKPYLLAKAVPLKYAREGSFVVSVADIKKDICELLSEIDNLASYPSTVEQKTAEEVKYLIKDMICKQIGDFP